jgi:putative RNA 2'-phosphotransferase
VQVNSLIWREISLTGIGGEEYLVRLSRMNRRLTKISKYLSFVLKHHPESIGLQLSSENWANVEQLIDKANASGKSITLELVQDVVKLDERKMFVFSDDGLSIRAQ